MDLNEYALEFLVRDRLAEMRERREHWSQIEWMRRPPRSVRVRLVTRSSAWARACRARSMGVGPRHMIRCAGEVDQRDAGLIVALRRCDPDAVEQFVAGHVTHDLLTPRQPSRMAEGRRVNEFPQQIIGNQRLPLGVVVDERLDMSVQEIGGDRHLIKSCCRSGMPQFDLWMGGTDTDEVWASSALSDDRLNN